MKMLVKALGGSTAYGLNTPKSDLDYRGVFVNTEPAKILGLEKFSHIQKQETDDIVYYEVRKFFELLRQGNTGALEILYSNVLMETTPEFTHIQEMCEKFVDTERMFQCLRGYMQGERRLANGERTGQLGGKRKEALEKYGFSPKNAMQLLRLAFCGEVLFSKGYFPVNVKEENELVWKHLFSIKTEPEKYTKEGLNKMFDAADLSLAASYEARKYTYVFDEELANEMLRVVYLPYLV
jgi:hypothetical protein